MADGLGVGHFSELQVPVLVFGEVLLDEYPGGMRVLGGAPFNVAWALRGFGHAPVFVSAIGDDAVGNVIREHMESWKLGCDGLQLSKELGSGTVNVELRDKEPHYTIATSRAWDFIKDMGWSASDFLYHGSLALRSEANRSTLRAIIRRSSGRRFYDVNLRSPHTPIDQVRLWLQDVDWLKLNIDELVCLNGQKSVTLEKSRASVESLMAQYRIKNVLLTGGAQGACLFAEDGFFSQIPAPKPVRFVDSVGAGDAFSAEVIRGLMKGVAPDQLVEKAARFAAKICALQGATSHDVGLYT